MKLPKFQPLNHFWGKIKHEWAFIRLKQSLQEPPALGLPNYSKPFPLFVHEGNNQALGNVHGTTW